MTGFISGLAAPISSLLELKQAIGLPYQTSERHLRAFDAMCARTIPGRTC
jgi:integrase/recombinase XerD